jgi:hypothetical protein
VKAEAHYKFIDAAVAGEVDEWMEGSGLVLRRDWYTYEDRYSRGSQSRKWIYGFRDISVATLFKLRWL